MIHNNTLFSKEILESATDFIGSFSGFLVYNCENPLQIKAGKELWEAKWILATIIDHIFDYRPRLYFENKDSKLEYPEYWKRFLEDPKCGVKNAINYVENNFALAESTAQGESYKQNGLERNFKMEILVKKIFNEVLDNIDEIIILLNSKKKITDPYKPTPEFIEQLINIIKTQQKKTHKTADGESPIKLQQLMYYLFEQYKNPLLLAWQVYDYGWHSDFWEEGDSMLIYHRFLLNPREEIISLINSFNINTVFDITKVDSGIKYNLLQVYKHLLSFDFESRIL